MVSLEVFRIAGNSSTQREDCQLEEWPGPKLDFGFKEPTLVLRLVRSPAPLTDDRFVMPEVSLD